VCSGTEPISSGCFAGNKQFAVMDRAIDGPPKMGDMAREAVSHVVGLRLEYDKACAELLLGANADDDKRRQDLAKLMLSLAREPGSDPISVRVEAVRLMQQAS
jgi:hypothetical protein